MLHRSSLLYKVVWDCCSLGKWTGSSLEKTCIIPQIRGQRGVELYQMEHRQCLAPPSHVPFLGWTCTCYSRGLVEYLDSKDKEEIVLLFVRFYTKSVSGFAHKAPAWCNNFFLPKTSSQIWLLFIEFPHNGYLVSLLCGMWSVYNLSIRCLLVTTCDCAEVPEHKIRRSRLP